MLTELLPTLLSTSEMVRWASGGVTLSLKLSCFNICKITFTWNGLAEIKPRQPLSTHTREAANISKGLGKMMDGDVCSAIASSEPHALQLLVWEQGTASQDCFSLLWCTCCLWSPPGREVEKGIF